MNNSKIPRSIIVVLSIFYLTNIYADSVLSGGDGGHLFRSQCNEGERISEIHIRSAKRIDAITISCQDKTTDKITRTGKAGGNGGNERTFNIPNDDKLIGIRGWTGKCKKDTRRICGIQFITEKDQSVVFGTETESEFVFIGDAEIIGFTGRSGDEIDAIGTITMENTINMGPVGGIGGEPFSIGCQYKNDRIRSIKIRADRRVDSIQVRCSSSSELFYNSASGFTQAGGTGGKESEFILNDDEHIIGVRGTAGNCKKKSKRICSIQFVTNQRTSEAFGTSLGEESFSLNAGNEIFGFTGRSGDEIDSIGLASFLPSRDPNNDPPPNTDMSAGIIFEVECGCTPIGDTPGIPIGPPKTLIIRGCLAPKIAQISGAMHCGWMANIDWPRVNPRYDCEQTSASKCLPETKCDLLPFGNFVERGC